MAYEDLTTFTEQDPNNNWSQTSSRNTGSPRGNETSYVYKDYGASFFGNYEHDIDIRCTQMFTSRSMMIWGVSDNISNYNGLSKGQILRFNYDTVKTGTRVIWLEDREAGFNANSNPYYAISLNTTYYIRVSRSSSTVTAKIYGSSSDRTNDTNILATLSTSCGTDSYRYLYVGTSVTDGNSNQTAGWIENVDVGINQINLELEDTVNLNEDTEVDVSLEKVSKEETVYLTDKLSEQAIESKPLSLSEESDIKLNLSKEDIVNLAEDYSITVNVAKNLESDIRFVKQVKDSILNKLNTAIRSISDATNLFLMRISQNYDISSDIRTLALEKNNFNNDFRMLRPSQVPGDAGFQSLGKTYIKVYINSIEQTDIDIDSITITKSLNTSHSATFELGRAYDSTKPDINDSVEIKYDTWTLYKGYITQITPGDSPESMRINCQDEYWQQNKTNKYFFVGHIPTDNKEKYYTTISSALSSEFSWSPGIGSFVPQTMNCFGQGYSDCISQLVTNSGNFSWYYDVNQNTGLVSKKLWTAEQGDIITLDRQNIGENLYLHQVLSHSFREDIENLVNKLRVQMGDRVIRRFNNTGGSRDYPSYEYRSAVVHPSPDWDDDYEVLSINSDTGYGIDWHKAEDSDLYDDVFKRYRLPRLVSYLEDWTDRFDPVVIITAPLGSGWRCSIPLTESFIPGWYLNTRMKEGFTIDYSNNRLIFNEKVYLYEVDENGEATGNIRAPLITLQLWKKRYYSHTEDPNDDPESDITNPLMFFTDKMGSYPETIIDYLELGSLSVQVGGYYYDGDGDRVIVPSWDDTAFARDFANWQLSKTCDKRITGNINVALDTVTFYNITLSNRIDIPGVIESPLNIQSMTYNISDWTVSISLENNRYYKRTVNLPSRGE